MRSIQMVVSISIFFATSLFGEVLTVENFDRLEKEVENLDEQSLLIMDIDYTLVIPKDMIMRPIARKMRNKILKDKKVDLFHLTDREKDAFSILYNEYEVMLTDPRILSILERARENKVSMMAMTASLTGPFGLIPSIEEYRLNQLINLGIDFRDVAPYSESLHFHEYKIFYRSPTYCNGILFSDLMPKSSVFASFLKKIGVYSFKKVVFVDDRKDYLHSIEKILENEGVQFLGLHYVGMSCLPDKPIEEIGKLQFQYLFEHQKWIDDEQAKNILGL